jgi:cytochrome c oxidase subunit 3
VSAPSVTMREADWSLPVRGPVGMYCLIAAEAAIFTIFVVGYIFYIGKSASGPQPHDVLRVPIFLTICLLSCGLTIHFAVKLLSKGRVICFALWWLLTVALGAIFLAGTAREWRHLIHDEGLTLQTNLFGITYYSLAGLHAFHVTHAERAGVLSMYGHFCGCGLGSCIHRRIYSRTLKAGRAWLSNYRTEPEKLR